MTKRELRILYKKKRMALSTVMCAERNEQIFNRLLAALEWSSIGYVHVYLPIAKFNEPDTIKFAQWLRLHCPAVKLVISQSDFEQGTMSHFLWDDGIVMATNYWGITEPLDGQPVDERQIDVVLMPLLVADVYGNRVGYGKGFYDRFLERCRGDVKTIGLSFFNLVETIDDVEPWDYALDCCITPDHTYTFDKGRP